MITFGVSMVRDEADVIEGTLRHMADEVDELIVADNGSVDGTTDILYGLLGDLPLTVLTDSEPGYYQSSKMTLLAAHAAAKGADWIVPFDADELWFSRLGRVREVLADVADYCGALCAELTNHFCTAIDEANPDPFRSMIWRQRKPAPLWKVAFRWEPAAVIAQGNHDVALPSGAEKVAGALEIRHFPYRSAAQFVRKARNGAAAYRAASGLSPADGAHWRAYGEILERHGEEALEDVFRQHFWYLSPIDAGMVRDPAPYLRWRHHAA